MVIVQPIGIRVNAMEMTKTVVDAGMIETAIDIAISATVARNEIAAIAIEVLFGRCPQSAGRFVQFLAIWFIFPNNC